MRISTPVISTSLVCNLFYKATISLFVGSGGSRISRRGGVGRRRGDRGPPRRLRFENFACQNERIWTRRGARAGRAPLDPPMVGLHHTFMNFKVRRSEKNKN